MNQPPTPVRLNQGESISLLTGQVFAPANVAPANLLLEIALGQNDLRGLAVAFKIAVTPVEEDRLSTLHATSVDGVVLCEATPESSRKKLRTTYAWQTTVAGEDVLTGCVRGGMRRAS